jgi:hypothetical protein
MPLVGLLNLYAVLAAAQHVPSAQTLPAAQHS